MVANRNVLYSIFLPQIIIAPTIPEQQALLLMVAHHLTPVQL